MMESIKGQSIRGLNDIVPFKEGVTSTKRKYTLRQMILTLKNPMPATKEDYPYLFMMLTG